MNQSRVLRIQYTPCNRIAHPHNYSVSYHRETYHVLVYLLHEARCMDTVWHGEDLSYRLLSSATPKQFAQNDTAPRSAFDNAIACRAKKQPPLVNALRRWKIL
jgi:hypothetical protein